VSIQKTIPSLDLQYTWAQKPVKLEDALGRIIPVPSEYDWNASKIQVPFDTLF
jgi:hypothetical protein